MDRCDECVWMPVPCDYCEEAADDRDRDRAYDDQIRRREYA